MPFIGLYTLWGASIHIFIEGETLTVLKPRPKLAPGIKASFEFRVEPPAGFLETPGVIGVGGLFQNLFQMSVTVEDDNIKLRQAYPCPASALA